MGLIIYNIIKNQQQNQQQEKSSINYNQQQEKSSINYNQQNQQQEKQEEPLKYQDKIDATINSVRNALKTTTLTGPAVEDLFDPIEELGRLINNDPELSDEDRALNLKYLDSLFQSKIRGDQSQ